MINEKPLIEINNLSKKFTQNLKRSLLYGISDSMRISFNLPVKKDRLRPLEFWALQNIDLSIKRGETVALLGFNGCGKSTLLRMITGLYLPSDGSMTTRGQMVSMIALGAGFHPFMTGIENIYLNASVLGMKRKEVDEKLQAITDFADLPHDMIHAPVEHYSSGMKIKLGFSIALHTLPDIIIIDEVLAVSDNNFKNKAMRALKEIQEKTAIIFVSHNMAQVSAICTRGVVMEDGKISFDGNTEDAISYYHNISLDKEQIIHQHNIEEQKKEGNLEYSHAFFADENHNEISELQAGKDIHIIYKMRAKENITSPIISLGLTDHNLTNIFTENNILKKEITIPPFEKDKEYQVKVTLKSPPLRSGTYILKAGVIDAHTLHTLEDYDTHRKEIFISHNTLRMTEENKLINPETSYLDLESNWQIEEL